MTCLTLSGVKTHRGSHNIRYPLHYGIILVKFAEEGENDAIPEEPHADPRGVPVPAQEEDGPGAYHARIENGGKNETSSACQHQCCRTAILTGCSIVAIIYDPCCHAMPCGTVGFCVIKRARKAAFTVVPFPIPLQLLAEQQQKEEEEEEAAASKKSQLKPDEGGDEEYGTAEGQGVKEMEDAKCSQGAPVKGNSICWVGFSTYSAKRLKGPWFCPMDIHRPKELSLLEIKYSVLRSFISHPNGCYKLDQINMKFT